MKWETRILLIFLFSFLGGLFKIIGGVAYSSKSVFVDALTSIANFLSLVLTFTYLQKSYEPPDKDHHFGHYRLKFGGSIFTLMTYSFVAGIALIEVISPKPYEVSIGAPVMAGIGLMFYLASIILSSRSKEETLKYYAAFTLSEVIEGITVVISSLVGAIFSYLVDYFGSVALTVYIFYELYESFKKITIRISDVAPPESILNSIKKKFEDEGFKVEDIRMRYIDESRMEGHVTIEDDRKSPAEEEILDKIKRDIYDTYQADVYIERKKSGFRELEST